MALHGIEYERLLVFLKDKMLSDCSWLLNDYLRLLNDFWPETQRDRIACLPDEKAYRASIQLLHRGHI